MVAAKVSGMMKHATTARERRPLARKTRRKNTTEKDNVNSPQPESGMSLAWQHLKPVVGVAASTRRDSGVIFL
jgi:hypothetical protein